MTSVEFIKNKNQTVTMFINNKYIIGDIPYIPEKCIDQRGLNLYLYLKNKELLGEGIDLKCNEGYNMVINGFNYMFNPVYVLEAVKEYQNDKKIYY